MRRRVPVSCCDEERAIGKACNVPGEREQAPTGKRSGLVKIQYSRFVPIVIGTLLWSIFYFDGFRTKLYFVCALIISSLNHQ